MTPVKRFGNLEVFVVRGLGALHFEFAVRFRRCGNGIDKIDPTSNRSSANILYRLILRRLRYRKLMMKEKKWRMYC